MKMENKAKKFDPNLPTAVELAFDEPKTGEGKYGTWYLYGISPLITGETGFFATDLLHKRLQEMGAKKGDKMIITKVAKDDKTFFDVKREGGDQVQEVAIEDVPKVINEVNTEMTLEQKVNILWSEYDKKQPKKMTDDLPF